MELFEHAECICRLAQAILSCLNQPAYIRKDDEILFRDKD
jgi:hypothetical protein